MKTTQPAYFTAYSGLKMNRDAQGVLVVEFHTNGGPHTFTAHHHTEFVDAFYRIAQDHRLWRTGFSSTASSGRIRLAYRSPKEYREYVSRVA